MFRSILAVLIVLMASVASAQVPTNNRRSLIFDSMQQVSCNNTTFEVWNMHNGTCSTTGTAPWVASIRVVSNGVVTTVPRAQVTRLTVAADCAPNPAPCLKVNDVVLNPGNVTVAFVTDAGVVGGASAAVPFTPTAIPPVAPTGLRTAAPVPE